MEDGEPQTEVLIPPARPSRRKRKLPKTGSTQLINSTIDEHGVFGRELDSFNKRLQQAFGFIQIWGDTFQNSPTTERAYLQRCISSACASNHVFGGMSFSVNPNLAPGIEEELQARYERTIAIAQTLRYFCSRERDQKHKIFRSACDCFRECKSLLEDATGAYKQDTSILKRHIAEMEEDIDKLTQEKKNLTSMYSDIIDHATAAVEELESDLALHKKTSEDALEKLRLCENENTELTETVRILEEREINTNEQQDKISSLSEELLCAHKHNDELESDNLKFRETITELQEKLLLADKSMHNLEMAKDKYEILLDITLAQLRMREDERKKKALVSKSIHSSLIGLSGATSEDESEIALPRITTPNDPEHITQDSLSINSFESMSDLSSTPANTSMTSRGDESLASLSASLKSLVTASSPNIPPRTKKKKSLFKRVHKNVHKTQSCDPEIDNRTPPDRLSPISDEHSDYERHYQSDNDVLDDRITNSKPISQSLISFDSANLIKTASYESIMDHIYYDRPRLSEPMVQAHKIKRHSLKNGSRARTSIGEQVSLSQSVQNLHPESPSPKRHGLKALAKDIERRFKKKKRSKTADVSQFKELQLIHDKKMKGGSVKK